MKRKSMGRWMPTVVPLTAALFSPGCGDDNQTITGTLIAPADAGADSTSVGKNAGKASSSSSKDNKTSKGSADAAAPASASNDKSPSQPGNTSSKDPANMQSSRGADSNVDPAKVELQASKLGFAGGFIDFDGDDHPDQLVGAPHAQRDGRLGVAFVYAGDGKGFADKPTAALGGDRDFGYAFANLGDVDGDGDGDYAVGAPHGDGPEVSLAGSVSVFAGGSRGKLLEKLSGSGPTSKYGLAIAGGDFNGDGKADLAVGAPLHTSGSSLYQTGAVFVHLGPKLDTTLNIEANAANKGLGWAVAAGDLNGDNIDDLVLSATSSAKVLVFFGKADFKPSLDAPDLAFTSKASGFGKVLAVVSDYSGDGHNELAIAAPSSAVGAARDVGSVFVVMAHGTSTPTDLDASPAPHQIVAKLDGPALFSRFGAALATAQDLDDDGLSELVIGAPMTDEKPDDMVGKVFMFPSKQLASGQAKSFAGTSKFGGFGSFVAPGRAGELLVGAPRSDADLGAAHLVDLRQGRETKLEQPERDADAGVEGEHDAHH